jgi:hypothetical protein
VVLADRRVERRGGDDKGMKVRTVVPNLQFGVVAPARKLWLPMIRLTGEQEPEP